eukprot:CAMPEP_0182442320 /NCGR_PEP_ID=MMETSP1172-20130603/1239_1 /TAXON_ID=708627 /ORGANISM="Timspurckia oligopyrenoides, Strain CCMP3278" /LENGTH=447 /DNA_ID=CAMNT_0024637095 /DNA_START=151 /DNA_END=1494 /DNA_ORIENTATION=+
MKSNEMEISSENSVNEEVTSTGLGMKIENGNENMNEVCIVSGTNSRVSHSSSVQSKSNLVAMTVADPVPSSAQSVVSTVPSIGIRSDVVAISLLATLRLMMTIGIGALAQRRGVLDSTVLSSLSKAVYNIFLPSILFVNVGTTLCTQSLLSVAPLPLLALAQILFGALLGKVLCRVLRVEESSSDGRILNVSCMFGNSAALPLLFANNLFAADPTRLAPLIAGISFFLIGWSPLFWSLGYYILSAPRVTVEKKTKQGKRERMRALMKSPIWARIFAPPIIGALAGLVFGSVPFLRNLVFAKDAPLGAVVDALKTLGSAYTPCAVLVLAGSLATPQKSASSSSSAAVSWSRIMQIAGICIVRFIFMPIFALGTLRTTALLGILLDPMQKFTILMESIMPSAQNSVLILQLENQPEAASKVARLLFFIYLVAILPISAGISVFLLLTGA